MNWKKIFTIAALTGFSASVATGQGTAPTIVQGDYISNVFGQSNFIKNPNAKLNTKDVTVSSATVTRSTTTPLVATSEFNITTSTATGYADWATRTFDAGMKNQNCEARFTYRGFSVGSTTVQIRQGSNTVAQLTLTASTDPRIASINFPCGDLSSATTLRVQQATASLTGTNEIGGIYVGLATNQANVAQAEMIGGVDFSTILAAAVTGPASYWTNFTGSAGTATPVGKATSATTNLTVTFASLPAGEYQVQIPIMFFVFGGTSGHSCRFGIKEETSGQVIYLNQAGSTGAGAGLYVSMPGPTPVRFSFTGAATTRTFRIVAGNTGWTASANGSCFVESQSSNANGYGIYVYRFPTSSELVVTPERQNVYGGVKWSGNIDISTISSVTNAIINTTNFGTPTPFGKASIASSSCGLSANDVGVCFDNVPPGTYEITTSFEQGSVYSFGTPGATACSARIHVSGTSFSDTAVASAFTEVGASGQTDWVTLSSGVVTISSFQPKLSLVLKQSKSGNNGRCLIRSSANGTTYPAIPTITMKPLDQPSNSALYVQGPVQAAATGAAIPAGYVGESKVCSGSRNFVNNTAGGTGWSLYQSVSAGCTLTPGVYLVKWTIGLSQTSGTSSGQRVGILTTDSADGWGPTSNLSQGNAGWGNGTLSGSDSRTGVSVVTVTSSGIVGGTGFVLYGKVFAANHTTFTGDYNFDATIVRLN